MTDSPGALSKAVAFTRTILACSFVAIYVLLVGPPGILLARLFRWPNILYRLGAFGVRSALFITGLRCVVEGGEHVDRSRAAVYCVNHSSNVEPPLVYLALEALFPRFQVLYKAELHKLPVLAQGFDVVGFVPVERGNRERSGRAIDQAVAQIRAGNSFLVFPEGTRSRSGELLPFRKGVFLMAIKAQAPIVPCAIYGAHRAMRKGSPIIWPVTVRIKFGRAVKTKGLSQEDRDDLIADIRHRVATLISDLKQQEAS